MQIDGAEIEFEASPSGLIYATSPDVPGLLIAHEDRDTLVKQIPIVMAELKAIQANPELYDFEPFCP